jgi:hypothetical protein
MRMTILIIIIIMIIIVVVIVVVSSSSSSTHHAFRPIRYRLEHVLPAPNAAIHPHLGQSQRKWPVLVGWARLPRTVALKKFLEKRRGRQRVASAACKR